MGPGRPPVPAAPRRHEPTGTLPALQAVPPTQLMKLMGHAKLDMVLRYYHSDVEQLQSTVDRVDFTAMTESSPTADPERKAQ